MALSPLTTTLNPQATQGAFGINAHGPGYIEVNGERFQESLILHPDHGPTPLGRLSAAELSAKEALQVADMKPEILLVGTGSRQVFLRPEQLAPLTERRIGVECMSTAAAARTFNLLVSEGRKVIALLLIEPHAPTP
jgi:uncharacterized protein